MVRVSSHVLLGLVVMMLAGAATAAESQVKKADISSDPWLTDYAKAMRQAKEQGKMLLVLFETAGNNAAQQQFKAKLKSDASLRAKFQKVVAVRVPTTAKIKVGGSDISLIQHGAFAELKGNCGVVMIDFAHKGTVQYGHVVSAIRFTPGKYYTFRPNHLNVLFDLPPGTLTQRTMIFAVRIHPEAPASAWGEKDPILTEEAASHSRHQAQIGVQGHHQWDTRFQRILGRLFGRRQRRAPPVEVVAESWPNQDLVDSCVDCVHSWRQSPGHWSAVQAKQAAYGYDIRRGSNGIWYATGIFSK